ELVGLRRMALKALPLEERADRLLELRFGILCRHGRCQRANDAQNQAKLSHRRTHCPEVLPRGKLLTDRESSLPPLGLARQPCNREFARCHWPALRLRVATC